MTHKYSSANVTFTDMKTLQEILLKLNINRKIMTGWYSVVNKKDQFRTYIIKHSD